MPYTRRAKPRRRIESTAPSISFGGTSTPISLASCRATRAAAVMNGVESLNFYGADQIIALGGGSVIDAAKMMKLKYESPDADFEDLGSPFLDLRKRVVEYPTVKKAGARLIAIPTTSGTGSEVTPFAVLFDKAHGRKICPGL